ncbi:MAG TPA: hypothetical protein ENH27_00315, partial [Rhizobiales bacterium]|nr:hypothetical protein [Hyphomicrobiales bacterium]
MFGAGITAAAAGVIAVGLTAGVAHGQTMKPCCDDTSVNYSKDLWSALAKAGLAGSAARADTPYKGQAPHGAILETLQSEVAVGDHKGK